MNDTDSSDPRPGDVVTEERQPVLSTQDRIVAAAIDVLASVSKTTLDKRADPDNGTYLNQTLVNPYLLRRLADLVEEAYPGFVDEIRDGEGA